MAGQLGGADHATRLTLLTGSMGTAARRKALLEAASGEAGIVIGTHALLEDKVQFADLGLVVIDEQHRFGVEQRDALRDKAEDGRPHVLVMTATPIPRTVAMTVFGDLDMSTLTELPTGPVADRHPPGAGRRAAALPGQDLGADQGRGRGRPPGLRRVPAHRRRRRPRAGTGRGAGYADRPDEDADGAPAGRRSRSLDLAGSWPRARSPGCGWRSCTAGCAPEEKDKVMLAFAGGLVDVLVTTTVVEVGVDVPNATVMVIMDADRFGVSQLHQLRGRVGRGSHAGLCLLVTEAAGGQPGPGTARRGREHDGRLRAVPDRPGPAP